MTIDNQQHNAPCAPRQRSVMVVFGTRPEAIKMAPLVKALQADAENFRTIVCVTGQHRQMLDQVLHLFEITPDYDLDIMKPGQDLTDVTVRILDGMRRVLAQAKPDVVLVHGDTSTSTAAALAAFYAQIPVGHVEAGLRTGDIYSPWPEEMNRRLTGRLATHHFAPTPAARENLLRENVDGANIIVTGNTVIDALYTVNDKIESEAQSSRAPRRRPPCRRLRLFAPRARAAHGARHRPPSRELRRRFSQHLHGFGGTGKALSAGRHRIPHAPQPQCAPSDRRDVRPLDLDNVFFIEPLEYLQFVFAMKRSYLIITDSGGIQEEAPSLAKPVLVMREVTERPEALAAGTIHLVGTDVQKILSNASHFLDDKDYYDSKSLIANPYGDGRACGRIVEYLRKNI